MTGSDPRRLSSATGTSARPHQTWTVVLASIGVLMTALDTLVVTTSLVASGTNSMLRELGGVLGIAVLASVFARQGVYQSPRVFIDGFTQALWVGVGFSAVGCVAALMMPTRERAALANKPSIALGVEEPASA